MTAKRKLAVMVLLAGCAMHPVIASAQPPAARKPVLAETPHLQNLLREEMQALQQAMRTLVTALPQGDWPTLAKTARAVHDSFIFEQKLTPEDKHILHENLPAGFVQLDQVFHQRAAKLHEAATRHDGELSVYYLSRMLESCVQCHTHFAPHRFPAFTAGEAPAHSH